MQTLSLVHDRPLPFAAIEMFLDLLRSAHGERLLRLKGIIELAEDPSRPLVVHAVQSILHPPARLPAWPDATRGTRLVLITLDMPEDYVRRLFAAISASRRSTRPTAPRSRTIRWRSPGRLTSGQSCSNPQWRHLLFCA